MAERTKKTKGKTDLSQRSAHDELSKETATEISKEIIMMKTEVNEELFNDQTTGNIEFVPVKEMHLLETDVVSYENEMESNRVKSTDNVQIKDEVTDDKDEIRIFFEFEEKYRCEWCALEFEEATYLTNHYECCPNKTQELATQQNTNRLKEEDSLCGLKLEEIRNLTNHAQRLNNEEELAVQQDANGEEEEDCDEEICVSFDPEIKYSCTRCYLEFDETAHLREHYRHCIKKKPKLPQLPDIIEETGGGILVCSFCKLQIIDKEFYPKHIEKCRKKYLKLTKEEQVRRIYKCSKCSFAGVRRCDLQKHIFVHCDKKQFTCEVCGKLYKHKESLKYHMKAHEGKMQKKLKTKRFKCDKCEYTATDTFKLNVHMVSQHSDKVKQYKCLTCKFATHYKEHLSKHVLTHSGDKPYKCTYKSRECTKEKSGECKTCESGSAHICGYSAVQKFSLNMHILTHHSDKAKQYKCEICKFATHFKGQLKNHQLKHSDEKPFKCTYKKCNCAQKESCECSVCNFATAYKYCLESHIRQCHTKQKIHLCEKCPYSTANSSNLKLHIRRKHT